MPKFNGKAEDLLNFLNECSMRFGIQERIYNTVDKKIAFILSYFTEGVAKMWKEQHLVTRTGKDTLFNGTFEEFKNLLYVAFMDPGRAQDALHQLQMMRQGNKSIDKLNMWFRLMVQKTDLNNAANQEFLKTLYQQAIKQEYARGIILQGNALPTLED
jgi:hypothetical protein